MKPFFFHHRSFLIGVCHLSIVVLSLVTAFLLRFDFSPPQAEFTLLRQALGIVVLTKMVVFLLARLHRGWWRFVGIGDLVRLFLANVAASICFTTAVLLLIGPPFSRSIYFIDFLLCFLLTAGARFAVRLYNE